MPVSCADHCCVCCCCRRRLGQRDASFSSTIYTRDIQDYDNDALVVHMGAFEPPATVQQVRHAPRKQLPEGHPVTTSDSSPPSTPSAADDAEGNGRPANGKDVAKGGGGQGEDAGKAAAAANGGAVRKAKPLHLYAVAAPGMRRIPTSTQDITQCLSWGAPVELKRHWSKVQKGYFDAPGGSICSKEAGWLMCWASAPGSVRLHSFSVSCAFGPPRKIGGQMQTHADTASQMQMHAGPAVLTSQVWFFSGMQSCRCCSL
jgi:hypothetical protein